MYKIGAVILAGGQSRRMGENKAFLTLEGKTFLSLISGQLEGFEEILLSVDKKEEYQGVNLTIVEDFFPDCGPLGGMYSALSVCQSEYLFTISCDMPLYQKELGEYMCSFVDGNYDAYVLVNREGRMQPQCAIYSTRIRSIFGEQIKEGNCRIFDAYDQMRVRYIPLQHSAFSDDVIRGVNSPKEYANLVRSVKGPPIIAFCGGKNVGKTTLLSKIIPLLKEHGLQVAVIKHDGHDFEPDVPKTDSYSLGKAGALGVGIYSPYRYALTVKQEDITPAFFLPFFRHVDLILLEGGKDTSFPKIEILRSGVSKHLISNKEALIGICSDFDFQRGEVPIFSPEDYNGIVELILRHLRG